MHLLSTLTSIAAKQTKWPFGPLSLLLHLCLLKQLVPVLPFRLCREALWSVLLWVYSEKAIHFHCSCWTQWPRFSEFLVKLNMYTLSIYTFKIKTAKPSQITYSHTVFIQNPTLKNAIGVSQINYEKVLLSTQCREIHLNSMLIPFSAHCTYISSLGFTDEIHNLYTISKSNLLLHPYSG